MVHGSSLAEVTVALSGSGEADVASARLLKLLLLLIMMMTMMMMMMMLILLLKVFALFLDLLNALLLFAVETMMPVVMTAL